jgi:hypothetical protein
MRQQYARRTQVLTSVLGLIAFAIIVQMTRIQNSAEAAVFSQQAQNYAYESKPFTQIAARSMIVMDDC